MKARDEAVIPAARNRKAENTIYNNNACHPGYYIIDYL